MPAVAPKIVLSNTPLAKMDIEGVQRSTKVKSCLHRASKHAGGHRDKKERNK